ncbi:MAG: FxDxF family PEP-CTERM protein [Burkholderiales bacterium]
MKLKTLVSAAAAALALSFAGGALAVTQNAGTLTAANSSTVFTTDGSFADEVQFFLSAPGTLSLSVSDLDLPDNVGTILSNTTISFDLWDNIHPGGITNFLSGTDGPVYTIALGAGQYHIDLFGQSTGTNGGLYAVGLSVSAVPEPESYAMMLAGLGAMGFLARRRKTQQ